MARDLESSVLFRALSMRRTWVALFLVAYALVLSCSWRLLLSIHAWYAAAGDEGDGGRGGGARAWRALYAAVMCGGVFGAAAMAAAAAAAGPAAAVAWITVLVLLAFAGRSRRALVAEARRATADAAALALRVLLREGNAVAALSTAAAFLALLLRRPLAPAGAGGDDAAPPL